MERINYFTQPVNNNSPLENSLFSFLRDHYDIGFDETKEEDFKEGSD